MRRDSSPKRRAARRGPRAGPAILASALLVAAAAAWLSSRPRGVPGMIDPMAGLDAKQAYLTGVDLVRRGHAGSSVPYFRRALALAPDVCGVHCDYAAALVGAVGEARGNLGLARSVTRSSWERAAMIRDAFAEFDRAESLASSPADRAHVIGLRAQTLAIWGPSWNGLAEYGRARQLDPSSGELRGRSAQLARIMRDPRWSTP